MRVIYNSKMMTAFVALWAELQLLPPAVQLRDSHFVLQCVCSAPHSLAVPCCTSSGLCTNCSPRDKERLFLFPGIYEGYAVKAVTCRFLNSVLFTACDCSSPLEEIGRAAGIALMKQFGWRADLRDPDLEVVVLVCQMACCCFQNCPRSLLVCSLLPLHAGPWPLPCLSFCC